MNKTPNIYEFFKNIPILENKKNKKIAVYTAIFGNSDKLNEPHKIENEIDYFCFTDNSSLVSDKWNVIILPSIFHNPRMSARALKILSHKFMTNYEFSVWIDGSIKIINSIDKFVFKFCEVENFCAFSHPNRDCIYREALVCQLQGRDKFKTISNQMKWYKKLGYPKNNGLLMSGILVRQNNEQDVKTLNEEWWNVVENYSNRDQLSLNFVLWKYRIKNIVLDQSSLKFFFYIKPHKRINYYSTNGKKINRIRAILLDMYIKLRTRWDKKNFN